MPSDASVDEARVRVQTRLASFVRRRDAHVLVVTSDDRELAIMEESEGHDLVLLGPSRRPGLLDAVFSSRARRIAESVSASVVIGWALAEVD